MSSPPHWGATLGPAQGAPTTAHPPLSLGREVHLLSLPHSTNESQADPRRGDNLPAHLVYLYSTWENVQGGRLGKNGSDGAGVRYSEGGEVETHGRQGLQPLFLL